MTESGAPAPAPRGRSRFELAPPRRFLLPAILLLLSEQPSHGYSLVKELQAFNFGTVDGPSVYRSLAQLERDSLVESWSDAASSGHERRMYGLTPNGEQILRAWMTVIKDERDHLDSVLRRYQATGRVDATLAEIEGGWSALLGSPRSSVVPMSARRRLEPAGSAEVDDGAGAGHHVERFTLDPDRSVVMIEVRSTVGPITFGTIGVTGWVEGTFDRNEVLAGSSPSAHLEIKVDELHSGNTLYDAELLRRIDARRFPTATIDMRECAQLGEGRYRLTGELGFHGLSRPAQGTVRVTLPSPHRLVVTGEQAFDIRDYGVASPTVLMLRIYPDVQVRLYIEAVAAA
jgi:poly-beta-hydroxybutyrate-responsive repressor